MRTGKTYTIGCGECSARFIGLSLLDPVPLDSQEAYCQFVGETLVLAVDQIREIAKIHTKLYHYFRIDPNIQVFKEDSNER